MIKINIPFGHPFRGSAFRSNYICLLCLILNCFMLSGCMSVVARSGIVASAPKIYPGVAYDGVLLTTQAFPLALVDFPFSFVADTILLPVDIVRKVNDPTSRSQESVIRPKELKTGDMYLSNMVDTNDTQQKTPVDYSHAFSEYQSAAKNGDTFGEFNLGNAYYQGRGVPIDYQKAYEWYLAAANTADNRYAPPAVNLASMYFHGIYVQQDYKKAMDWYMKGVSCKPYDGYSISYCDAALLARTSLGDMYYNGIGIEKDTKTAFAWYRLAKELNIKTIPQVGMIKKELNHDELVEAKKITNSLADKYDLAYMGIVFNEHQLQSDYSY